MKSRICAVLLGLVVVLAMAVEARADEVHDMGDLVAVSGSVAGEAVAQTARGSVDEPVGLTQGVEFNVQGEAGYPICLPIWNVWYYPRGTTCPPQFVASYNNYAAAVGHKCSLNRIGYVAYIVRVR